MMDGIGHLELRFGPRRARAYTQAEPLIRRIERTIRQHRQSTGEIESLPPIAELVASCREAGLTAARGGRVTPSTVIRALKLMGLR
jgi:hypothetical protein